MRRLFVICALMVGACRPEAEYEGTFYSCVDGECPAGYVCGHDDRCLLVTVIANDAPRGDSGEIIEVIDAGADAGMSWDGPPPLVATFGERVGADYRDVTMDTFLDEGSPTENSGVHPDFHLSYPSEEIGLLRFEVSALPADAIVVAAELRIWTSADAEGVHDPATRVKVYRVLEQWQEGTGNFTADEVANWNERLPGLAWTTPGCGAPGSRDSTVLGETALADVDTEYTIPIQPAAVEGWIRDWTTNHGFALRPEGTAASDYGWGLSREFEQEGMRPLLVVTYLAP